MANSVALVLLACLTFVLLVAYTTIQSSEWDFLTATTLKGPVFKIADFKSNEPLVGSLYPGGFLNQSAAECTDDTDLLVMVFTAPANANKRQAIRENWGREAVNGTRLLFLVGAGGLTETQVSELSAENEQDIVFGNFTDSYQNLTLKSVAMVEWAWFNCPLTAFVLKCDDDMYINLQTLRRLLSERSAELPDRTVIGRLAHEWIPNRNSKSKYFLSEKQFPPEVLPDFATGPAYVLSGPLLEPLLDAALREHWIPLEDVFLTGIVANSRLGVRPQAWSEFVNDRVTLSSCNSRKIALHEVKPGDQSRLMERRTKKCLPYGGRG